MAYQYYCANEWEKLYSILIDSEKMIKICLHGDKLFAEYWSGILENTTHSLRDYLNVDFHNFPDWDADEQMDFLSQIIDLHFGDKQLVIELNAKYGDALQDNCNNDDESDTQGSKALTLVLIAQSKIDLGDMEEAGDLLKEAEKILKNVNHPDESFLYFIKGNLEHALGKYELAFDLYDKACSLAEEEDGKIPWKYINNRGLALLNIGKYKDAQINFERALSIIKEDMTIQTVEAAIAYNNLGLTFLKQGDRKHGEEMFMKSLEIIDLNLLHITPIKIQPLNNLGLIFFDRGDYEKAQELLSEAYEISMECTPRSIGTALAALNLGRNCVAKGDLDNGENLISESVDIYEKAVDFNHNDFVVAVIELMKVLIQEDKFKDALSFIDRIEKRSKVELDEGNLIEGYCRLYRSKVWMKSEINTKKIRKELKKAMSIFEYFEYQEEYGEAKSIFDVLN